MRIRVNEQDGFHVLCDRCALPARAVDGRPIWVEYDGDGSPEDEPLVVCAACNDGNHRRTKRLDTTLGDLLVGILINTHEPLGQVAQYVVAGREFFGEGDLASFVAGVSQLAQGLDDAGLG